MGQRAILYYRQRRAFSSLPAKQNHCTRIPTYRSVLTEAQIGRMLMHDKGVARGHHAL